MSENPAEILREQKEVETKLPIVINLFAGPGAGKSTSAAYLFVLLKERGVNCELVREYAKDKVWENSHSVLNDQTYVFGKQNHRMEILRDQVDVIITDSPLLFSIVYDESKDSNLIGIVKNRHNSYESVNVFLQRTKVYNPKGRMQSEDEAKDLDRKIWNTLKEHNVPIETLGGNRESIDLWFNRWFWPRHKNKFKHNDV